MGVSIVFFIIVILFVIAEAIGRVAHLRLDVRMLYGVKLILLLRNSMLVHIICRVGLAV